MDLNPINKPKRRRAVNKSEWTKEKRKRLRIAGQEYVNSKGETVASKEPGPDCKCRRRCYDKVPAATRMKLFKGYYGLKSHDEQNAYLFGLIRKVPIARKRAEGSTRRTCTFNYYIRVGGQETQVCVKALANIHGVGKSKIHILCEKLGQNVLFPRDERGRHSKMPKKVTDDTVEMVKQHIFTILHSDRVRDFLKDEKANNGPDVNITQMHKDFLDAYDPQYAQDLINYEKWQGHPLTENGGYNNEFLPNCEYRQIHGELTENGELRNPQIEVMVDSDGNAHQVLTADVSTVGINVQRNKKRKTSRDGRPEPIIRQWYYSKIFHDLYTTKEAIALRKKILSWKSNGNEDFMVAKPVRKQRMPKKIAAHQQQQHQVVLEHVLLPQDVGDGGHDVGQVHITQTRLSKGTNTVPITIAPQQIIQPRKLTQDISLQNFSVNKESIKLNIQDKNSTHTGILLESSAKQEGVPIELYRGANNALAGHKFVIQAQSQDVYSVYPMFLQDLTPIDAHGVTITQPIQQSQLRTLAPAQFHAAVSQPGIAGNAITITAGNLQALGINLAPSGTHYTTNHGIMSYKLE